MYVTAVILAAGCGTRFGGNIKKQFAEISGKPILAHSVYAFEKCTNIKDIVLVAAAEDLEYISSEIIHKYSFTKVRTLLEGGQERFDSALNGINSANPATDIILIHDGARPLINVNDIEAVIGAVKDYSACVAGYRATDTVKICDENGNIIHTPDRSSVWNAQTPQGFRYDIIHTAYNRAKDDGFIGTDDSMIVERLSKELDIHIKMIETSKNNIKITTAKDIAFAETIMDKYN